MKKLLGPLVVFFVLSTFTIVNVYACSCPGSVIEVLGVKTNPGMCPETNCQDGATGCCGCGSLGSSCQCCPPNTDCKTGSLLHLGVHGTSECKQRGE